MGRFLFSTLDLHGHIDFGGLLETARVLQGQGHEVIWASSQRLEPIMRRENIRLAAVPVAYDRGAETQTLAKMAQRVKAPTQGNEIDQIITRYLWIDMEAILSEHLLARACDAHMQLIAAWKPDAVIAEPGTLAAALAAEAGGVPLAGCGYPGPYMVIPPSADFKPLVSKYYERLERLRKRLGLSPPTRRPDPDFLFVAPSLHLVYTTPEWFDPYNPRSSPGARFVGSVNTEPRTPAPGWIEELPADRPIILICRATAYVTPPGVLAAAFDMVKAVGGYGLIGGQLQQRRALEPLPDHIRWEAWLPYEHLLPRISVMLHHGGFGTTCSAVRHGVPHLIMPDGLDQVIHAESVARSGAGIVLKGCSDPGMFTRALGTLIEDPDYRQAAARLRDRFAAGGGAHAAAELLVSLAEGAKLDHAAGF
jgi:UDP:flavonoid glycosyltransferase YjiC (YdhE family)